MNKLAKPTNGAIVAAAPKGDLSFASNQVPAASPDITTTKASNWPVLAIKLGNGLAMVSRECRGAPDDIFLVETAIDPWWVWPMKQDALKRDDSLAAEGGWNPARFGENELSD